MEKKAGLLLAALGLLGVAAVLVWITFAEPLRPEPTGPIDADAPIPGSASPTVPPPPPIGDLRRLGPPPVQETRTQPRTYNSFTVQVQRADGTPAADVEIQLHWERGRQWESRVLGKTDADGVVVGRRPFAGRKTCRVLAEIAGERVQSPLGPDEREVLLQLPPTGSWTLRAVIPGDPSFVAGLPSTQGLFLFDREHRIGRSFAWDSEGEVHLPHVPLDRQFGLDRANQKLFGDETVAGPTSMAPHRITELHLTPEFTPVSGRAVDRSGAPLAKATLYSSMAAFSPTVTDPDGHFLLFFRLRRHRRAELLIQVSQSSPRLEHWATLDPVQQTGHALGDTVFAPSALIVAGRVQDSQGEPVRFVPLGVVGLEADGSEVELSGSMHWSQDQPGRFEYRAHRRASRVAVFPTQEAFGGEPRLEAATGRDDLELTLDPLGTVEATVARQDLEHVRAVELALVPEGTRHPTEKDQFAKPHQGEFRWQVPAGAYDLLVLAPGASTASLRIEGLEVRSGALCRDARLKGIRLDEAAESMVRIRVRDATSGRRILHGWVSLDEAVPAPVVFGIYGGNAQMTVTGPTQATFTAPGYASKRLLVDATTEQVPMQRIADPLCTFDREGLPAGTEVQLSLRLAETHPLRKGLVPMMSLPPEWTETLDLQDEPRPLRAPAGPLAVRAYLRQGDLWLSVRVLPNEVLWDPNQGGTTTFELHPDDLTRWLKKLGR